MKGTARKVGKAEREDSKVNFKVAITKKYLRYHIDRGHLPSRFKYQLRDVCHVYTSCLLFLFERCRFVEEVEK